jgi:serine/threonine protein kinase
VGKGSFGTVVRATVKATGIAVVVKRLQEADFNQFLHEVTLLSQLEHPNVAAIVDVLVRPSSLAIVLADGGQDLRRLINERAGLLANWRSLLQQLLEAVVYIHSNLVIHSDIKPPNICVNSTGRLQLNDFGASVIAMPGFRSEVPRGCSNLAPQHCYWHQGTQPQLFASVLGLVV